MEKLDRIDNYIVTVEDAQYVSIENAKHHYPEILQDNFAYTDTHFRMGDINFLNESQYIDEKALHGGYFDLEINGMNHNTNLNRTYGLVRQGGYVTAKIMTLRIYDSKLKWIGFIDGGQRYKVLCKVIAMTSYRYRNEQHTDDYQYGALFTIWFRTGQ